MIKECPACHVHFSTEQYGEDCPLKFPLRIEVPVLNEKTFEFEGKRILEGISCKDYLRWKVGEVAGTVCVSCGDSMNIRIGDNTEAICQTCLYLKGEL